MMFIKNKCICILDIITDIKHTLTFLISFFLKLSSDFKFLIVEEKNDMYVYCLLTADA